MLKQKFNIWSTTLIILCWALLYLPHLRTSPSWYGDETLALTAGLDLTRGIAAHRAIWNTFWSPYAPYQPGYEYLIGWAARLSNGDIFGARLVNAILGLSSAIVIYFGCRKLISYPIALFAALLFLSYEQSIIHFRWIFTHNMVALGYSIAFLALVRKSSIKSDSLAGLGLGISALAIPISIYGVIAAGIIRLKRPVSWPVIFFPFIVINLLSLCLGYFLFKEQGFLWSDLQSTFRFYTTASAENGRMLIFRNFLNFFGQDAFHLIGFIMLLLCLTKRMYAIGVGGLTIAFLLLQNRQNLTLFYYQAILLLPLLAIAYGIGISRILQFIKPYTSKRLFRIVRLSPLLVPFVFFITMLPASLSGSLHPRIALWTTQSIREVETVARWVNKRVSKNDLVICHHNIAWLIHAKTADYLQVTTWNGLPTWPFDIPLKHSQFRYDADLKGAKYAIIADIDQLWTFHQPNVQIAIHLLHDERWPVVWSGSTYLVLANPRFLSFMPVHQP